MKKFYSLLILCFCLVALGACGGSGGDDDGPPPPMGGDDDDPMVVPDPTVATLIFPEDDTECNEGETVSDTESTVTFRWNASQNTDSYSVTLTNLSTGTSFNTIANSNETPITILRGTPYEWFVTSRANGTNSTAQSPTWRFYNEGLGIENYAPFPAEAVNPNRGATLPSGTTSVTLEWSASDVDGDIEDYEVFFGIQGTTTNTSQGTLTDTSLVVTVESGNTYEWSVVVSDSQDNASTSETFLFRVGE
ncbi:hypothetical protein FGF1_11100 [Flavobacteriaceae bacterium GF1]